jgi:pimeloyl-ACP methyl ester carboxylesterase
LSTLGTPVDLPVEGGALRALRFGDGPRLAVALHGITASAMGWRAIGRQMSHEWSLLALDLRGRGGSADLPGPYGLRRHASDVSRVVADLGAGPVVLVGHSMGGYVAVLAAAARPGLYQRLVLIDGGLAAPLPPGADPDEVLAATIGPALTRLQQTFASEQAYLDFFRAHPALADAWNDDIEAYVRYDLTGPPGRMRSRVREDAVREDGRDVFGDADVIGAGLRGLRMPTLLLTAPKGLFGQPPGFLPDQLVAYWRQELPHLQIEQVADTNHYTIAFAPHGAAVVASRITDPSTWPRTPQDGVSW